MANKKLHAEIKTPEGTSIILDGDKDDVAKVVQLFSNTTQVKAGMPTQLPPPNPSKTDFTDVAEVDESGTLNLVATDLKAKTALNAAERLTYVTLLARRELLNETQSPRKELTKTLINYGLNDGNSRRLIANDKALVKKGKTSIQLSSPAVKRAREFVKEIQDSQTVGKWYPSGRRKSKKQREKS